MIRKMAKKVVPALTIFALLLGATTAWSAEPIRSPYRSLAKTKEFLDTAALRVMFQLNYTERAAKDGDWKTVGAAGVIATRLFSRNVDGRRRTVELAVASFPEAGFELHVYGSEIAKNETGPNPDLDTIYSSIASLAETLEEQHNDPERKPNLAYEIITLSYMQTDRALAVLKSLGYTVVEFEDEEGESPYEKIFKATVAEDERKYPYVVKLVGAEKTSMMDPPKEDIFQTAEVSDETASLPDLGGLYLHGVTTGEPLQRLMIVYDPDAPEEVEPLLDLLQRHVDVPAQQILIDALVIELNADNLSDIGIGYAGTGRLESSVDGTSKRWAGSYGDQLADPVAPGGTNPFNFVFQRLGLGDVFNFRTALSALVERGDAEVLSNPSVLVMDGRQARIQVGRNVPVVETTKSADFGESSSVRYFPVGIVLNLRPRVARGGEEVTMQVETIVSSTALNLTDSALFAPVVDNRQVQTFVRVANDTPFIIGGLISSESDYDVSGIPILSSIPVLGNLFRSTRKQNVKREVIVVLTPHVVPQETKNFSYVIPQESELFDSFEHQLFRNAYRVREQDVFDLKFLYASEFFEDLQTQVKDAADIDRSLREQPQVAAVLDGGVPGEEVLVRRMLWEIIYRRLNLSKHVVDSKIIFFESDPNAADGSGFKLSFLANALGGIDRTNNALVLTYNTDLAGSAAQPFVQPRATISYQPITPDSYVRTLRDANVRKADGEPDQWSAIFTRDYAGITADPLELVKTILVLKRVLELNPQLDLTIPEFYAGRQIVFPTAQDLSERFHLLDPEAMQLFYQVALYYPAFEQEFMYQSRQLLELLRESGALD